MIRLPAFTAVASLILLSTSLSVRAGTSEEDWAALVELDKGPQAPMRSQAEAQGVAAAHIEKQERMLRTFLREHPKAPQAFEARLRLSRALQIRGEWQKLPGAREEAQRLLEDAAKIATPEQRVEVDFSQLTLLMRTMKGATPQEREQLLVAARRFQNTHVEDRRVPKVLVEVASLFDHQPRTKRSLLSDAQALSRSDAERARITDDLKRLDLLGAPVPLRFTSMQGQAFDLADARGKVVVVVFFADWSPPSLTALKTVKAAAAAAPAGRVQVVGVSLDDSATVLKQTLQEQGISWPVAFDGKGWMSPLVRELGINVLPTVWLIDAQGRLRSLKGLEDTAGQLRQLAAER